MNFLCILFWPISTALAVHLKGIWNYDEHIHIVTKFGVRQLNPLNKENTKGFIYGNVTVGGERNIQITASNRGSLFIIPETMINGLFVDSQYSASCGTMLRNISQFAFESKCLTKGKRSDLLRWVPCPMNQLCAEEDNALLVVPGYQFTFRIQEPVSPEFWYVVFISCSLGPDCNWTESVRDFPMNYDIWMVNGNPESNSAIFSKQFSYEEQDIIHIYMFALQMYVVLILCQIRAASITRQSKLDQRQRLLNCIIGFKFCALVLQSIETFIFALFGRATVVFMFVGELLRIFAVCLLCLLLILVSRGWSLNQSNAFTSRVKYVWIVLSLIHVAIFVNRFVNIKNEGKADGINFLSSHGIIITRMCQGAWFLFEVKRTILREQWEERAVFLVHFGAAYMVWFIFPLGLGVITAYISDLWRLKIILAISTFANFVAIACLVHIFWPNGSNSKFFSSDTHVHRSIERVSSTDLDEFEKMLIGNDDDQD